MHIFRWRWAVSTLLMTVSFGLPLTDWRHMCSYFSTASTVTQLQHERILPAELFIFPFLEWSCPVLDVFDSFKYCLNTRFIIRSSKFFKVSEPQSVHQLLKCMCPETIDSSDSPSHANLAHDSLTHPQWVRQASAGNQDKQKMGALLCCSSVNTFGTDRHLFAEQQAFKP